MVTVIFILIIFISTTKIQESLKSRKMNYSIIKNTFKIGLVSAMVFTMFSCDEDAVQTLPERNWTLVWSDEFDDEAGASIDETKWSFDTGNGESGWGNNELQNYTSSTDNVQQDGEGNLMITAINNSGTYTSGRIKTKGLFSQAYGRFEARIKTPYGPGIWPAFWMLGSDVDTNVWPYCGEIDIMELRGQEPNVINGTLHGPGYSAGSAITKAYGMKNARFDSDYHIFAVEWTEDKIDFFVDDYLYQRVTKSQIEEKGTWVYDHSFFLILNVAVGGNYVGYPTSETPFPQTMYVDYVRVYQ